MNDDTFFMLHYVMKLICVVFYLVFYFKDKDSVFIRILSTIHAKKVSEVKFGHKFS